MKRNLLVFLAVALAAGISSFTVKKITPVYFIYQSGDQNIRGSYNETQTSQTFTLGGSSLNWFRIDDDNGTVTNPEFNTAFSGYDTNGNLTLNDQSEIVDYLDKK